jgi:ArsR family transcriptional regulator, cadmium/lead-responsive transcriptional repressor
MTAPRAKTQPSAYGAWPSWASSYSTAAPSHLTLAGASIRTGDHAVGGSGASACGALTRPADPELDREGIIFHVAQMVTPPSVRVRARFFDGLADPARLALLDALRAGERTASDAASASGLTPSNASKHLACLRECGLVESRQDWRHVYYRLGDGVSAILDANDTFIEQVADRIAACQRPEMRR